VIDFLVMLPAFVLGWIVVRLLMPIRSWILQISLGVGLGAGITSSVYFLFVWAGIANRATVLVSEAVMLAAAALLFFRSKPSLEEPVQVPKPSWIWALRGAVILAMCMFALDVSEGLTASPGGEYDAAAIWNLRARYLAAGSPSWRYAVSDKTGTNHPGYPLLTSSFISRTWTILGDTRSSTPAWFGLMLPVVTLGVLFSSVTLLAGETAGLLAVLILLATVGFVSQATAQYADIPLSYYILSSLALFALSNWSKPMLILAGAFAGFGAWTKNEGWPFVAFICAIALWRGGQPALRWIATGAAFPLLLTLAFKIFLVDGREAMFPKTVGDAVKLIFTGGRWGEIIGSFVASFWTLGFPWAHPLLLMAILVWAFGFAAKQWWLLVPPLGLLAADFGIYLITANDLTWHLNTSNNRVIVQAWPAILFGFFVMLKAPATNPGRTR
jgi:hypothetical protein